MGESKAQVKIEDTGVFLYTQQGSGEIEDTVRKVLQRRQRWDDEDYLTSTIFWEMTRYRVDEKEACSWMFAIGNDIYLCIDVLITINIKAQTVTVINGLYWGKETEKTFTFTEFIGAV